MELVMEDTEAETETVSSRKKPRDRIQQLSELRRGLVHRTVAQYGTTNNPVYVMDVVVDGMDFQGIGPSKKRAKVMASEWALVFLGELDVQEVQTAAAETSQVDDYTSDTCAGLMYLDFASPTASAKAAALKLPQYEPEESDIWDESYSVQEMFQIYVGRNAISILSELRPDAIFDAPIQIRLSNPTKFVTKVRLRGRNYQGEATSKKVSKGRAAAMVLCDVYGVKFGTTEDGMPIYEDRPQVWETQKRRLEHEVETSIPQVSVVHPVEKLNEMFPEADFEFPDAANVKPGGFFRAVFTIDGEKYEGIGLSKKDAKANAATNALEGLDTNGKLAQRQSEIEGKRKQRKPNMESMENAPYRSPVIKLGDLYPESEVQILGETPLRNTKTRAFIAHVKIAGQIYVGVGKSKKLAKLAAAEKALKALRHWTVEDEAGKSHRAKASVAMPLHGVEEMSLYGRGGNPFGRNLRGRGRGNFGAAGPRGRGFGGYESWLGFEDEFGLDDDGFGGDPGLDMMVGELSQLVGRILASHPHLGVSEVWNMLQHNREYKLWCRGAMEYQMQSGYDTFDEPYDDPESYGAFPQYSHGPQQHPWLSRPGRGQATQFRGNPRGRRGLGMFGPRGTFPGNRVRSWTRGYPL